MPTVDFGPLSSNLPRSVQKGLSWMNLIFNNMLSIDCRFYVLRTNTRAVNNHGNKYNWIIFVVTTLSNIKIACFDHREISFSFRAEVRNFSVLQSKMTYSGTHSSSNELVSGPVSRKEPIHPLLNWYLDQFPGRNPFSSIELVSGPVSRKEPIHPLLNWYLGQFPGRNPFILYWTDIWASFPEGTHLFSIGLVSGPVSRKESIHPLLNWYLGQFPGRYPFILYWNGIWASFPEGTHLFSIEMVSGPVSRKETIHPRLNWYLGQFPGRYPFILYWTGIWAIFPEGKWKGREYDHSLSSYAEYKNKGSYNSLPHILHALNSDKFEFDVILTVHRR